MFKVTDEMRVRIRKQVAQIKQGARPCGNLRVPAYLAGDGVKKPGMHPHSTQNLLNPIDPVPYARRREAVVDDDALEGE